MNAVTPIVANPLNGEAAFPEYPFYPETEIETDGTRFVRNFLRDNRLRVNAFGAVRRIDGNKSEEAGHTITEILLERRVNAASASRDLLLHHTASESEVKRGEIMDGFRAVLDHDAWIARAQILHPLYLPLTAEETARAEHELRLLCETCFKPPANIAVALIKKFIHQVKRKALNLDVTNHLMLIVVGHVQGRGKSTFVLKLLSVLGELASGSTNLSALVDERNIQVFSRPAVFLDDMEALDDKMVERLKTVITSKTLERRVMFSQSMVEFEQEATFIATSNREVWELIRDRSGMRRFGSVYWRDEAGTVAWGCVNSVAWQNIWRLVDHRGSDPILPFKATLADQHTAGTPRGILRAWVERLDLEKGVGRGLKGMSGVSAKNLKALFDTEHPELPEMQPRKFCEILKECIKDGIGPFRSSGLLGGAVHFRTTEPI